MDGVQFESRIEGKEKETRGDQKRRGGVKETLSRKKLN